MRAMQQRLTRPSDAWHDGRRPRARGVRMPQEGYVDVPGGRVWYMGQGSGDGVPVLILHGGPGAASYYMQPLADRLAAHRPAIVYDQLGCGRSDIPDDTSLWTVDRSVAEVDAVRAALGLDRCHLLGQSWGGWLAIETGSRGSSWPARRPASRSSSPRRAA